MRLNLGIRRRLAPLLDNDRRKIELANSLLFTLPGSPIIYYGDEIGMGDNIWLHDRNGVRTPMQWQSGWNAGFSTSDAAALYAPLIQGEPYGPQRVNVADQQSNPDSLWHALQRMVAIRKTSLAFGRGSFAWLESASQAVAGYWREFQGERLLILNNLSGTVQQVRLPVDSLVDITRLLGVARIEVGQDGTLEAELPPYGHAWLKISG
jgi:maltose alpha-D-glucosyltransferase / alpha-amylase